MLVGEAAHVATSAAAAPLVPHQRFIPVAGSLLRVLKAFLVVVAAAAGVAPLRVHGHDGELGVPAPLAAVRVVAGDAHAAVAAVVGEFSLGAEIGEAVAEVVGRDDGVEHLG